MNYSFRYINKQVFPNSISYTLLIEDENKNVTRMEKSFKADPNIIDGEYLRIEAMIEIDRLLEPIPEEVAEVQPDEALSDG